MACNVLICRYIDLKQYPIFYCLKKLFLNFSKKYFYISFLYVYLHCNTYHIMRKFITGFLATLYIIYLMGIIGLFRGAKRSQDKAVPLFTILAGINVILWIVMIKLIIKII